jgi:hypothetical protein
MELEVAMPGYGAWEGSLLANLESAGPDGARTADYIKSKEIAILTVDNNATNIWWKWKIGWRGPYLENSLYISRFLADKHPNNPWLLSAFVHETRHLQQGFWTAFSVYGEMEAWQLGFNFYKTLPAHGPINQPVQDLLAIPLSHDRAVLKEARRLINLDQNNGAGFWHLVLSLIRKERAFNQIYWICALPLNPLFPTCPGK